MSALTIHSVPGDYRVAKSLIAAQYNNVKVDTPKFELGKDNRSAAFEAKNALKKVPVADTPFGSLAESGAILRYVARLRPDTGLLGSSFYQQAQVDQWVDFSGFEVEVARAAWLYTVNGVAPFNANVLEQAKAKTFSYIALLDKHLLTRTYLVGNQVTLADIVLGTAFVDLVKQVLTPASVAKYGNFVRWFETIVNQPQFSVVLGEVKWAAKEATVGGAPAAAAAGKGEQKGKDKGGEQKKGGDKPKGEAAKKGGDKPKNEAKKEAKKEAAPKKEEVKAAPKEEDLDDNGLPVEKKKTNPLDLLPKSNMSLDATKKLFFASKPFNPKFFDEFWPTWDPAGFSVYTCEYKYNNEFTLFFLAGNLIGGFLQRVDELRKYGFGSLSLIGETDEQPPWKCVGCWVFRGQDLPQEMKDCDDSEHYTWTKVDCSTAAGKATFAEYFTGDKIQGLPVQDRRYFK